MSQNNLVGKQLGQYEFRKLLGKGGMGEVYHAYDSRMKRDVAIKIMAPELVSNEDLLKRFEREAKTCAKLDHPNIVKIYDFGTKNQITYMVLQFLTGGVLSDRLLKSSNDLIPISDVINWIKQISGALDYAHRMGVIHRDIKPANIMFDVYGRAYVVDFGIVKIKSQSSKGVTDLTKGVAIGTYAFMPPEQWRGDELTGQADQYALAVMTYQLLCGKLPFEADNFYAFMHKHHSVTPTLLSELRRDISPDVDNVMMRALAKDPQHRFNTCTEFALALEQAIYGHLPNLNNNIPAIQNDKPQEKKSHFAMLSFIGGGIAFIIILLMILLGGTGDNATVTDDTSQTLTIANSQDTPLTATHTISFEEMARVTIERMETQTSEALVLVSTATIMPSETSTPTITPSDIPSATATSSYTPTITATPSDTSTPSDTPTSTTTPSDTPTSTITPSDTPTSTITPTATVLAGYLGGANITINEQWIPIQQEFDGVPMVLVPIGCFMMGSDVGDSDEQPVHEQCFDEPFWIDKYEVTQAQFARLNGQKANPNQFIGDDLPVESITWFEARDFCVSRGGRLPTEAEWEYAARGPNNLIYPWGNDFVADNVVYSDNSDGRTAPVGSRVGGVSWVGAMDMSGNVWEWVGSLYEPYPYDADHERTDDDNQRVLRGGAWLDIDIFVRSTYRDRSVPTGEGDIIGFRCVILQ